MAVSREVSAQFTTVPTVKVCNATADANSTTAKDIKLVPGTSSMHRVKRLMASFHSPDSICSFPTFANL
jgi:hypothetical protein